MAKIYGYEYEGSCYERTADFVYYSSNTIYVDHYDQCCGQQQNEFQTQTWRVTLNSSAPVDIDVLVTYRQLVYSSYYSAYVQDQTWLPVITVPAGQTSAYFHIPQYYYAFEYSDEGCPGAGCITYETTMIDIAILDQPSPPTGCLDPDCALQLTGVIVTPPTQRGGSDGTIFADTIETSGNTIGWYINSVYQDPPADSHIFTGLTAGNYYIKAEIDSGCSITQLVTVTQGELRTGEFLVLSPTENVVAVENPILLTLRTATSSFNPSYAVNTFQVTGTISDVVIEFNLTFPYTYYAVFKSKAFPDRSNYFLESVLKDDAGITVGSNTNVEIATSLAEALQKDAILSRLFFITNSGTTVTLKSKEYNDEFNLTSSNVTITGSNLTLTNTIPGVTQYDGQLSPEYSLYGELFVNDDIRYGQTPDLDYYNRIIELELPFDKTNIHQFDFSSALKNFVYSDKLDFSFTGFTYMVYPIGSYFIKYGEKYPLIAGKNTKKKRYKGETGYGWFMNASLDFEDPNDLSIYFGDTGATFDNNFSFLNTAPNTKVSNRHCKEFMSFVVEENYGWPLAVYADITLYDGTVHSNVKMYDIHTGSTYYGGVIVANVGYTELGLSSYETSSKIRKVDITIMQEVTSGWTAYSETKTYYLDIDEHCDKFNVAFLNSLGTYETYSFVGELIESQDTERMRYQRPYELNSDGSAEEGFLYNATLDTKLTRKYTLNTGIINADTFYFLRGMLNSNRIYHYDAEHENYLNIVGETATKSTNDNEYSLQLQVIETIIVNNVNS